MDTRLKDFKQVAESDEYWFKAMEVHRAGKIKRAIQLYGLAHDLRPEASMPLLFRARASFEDGDFAGAIEDCTTIIDMLPDNSAAYNMRGVARYGAGDVEGAIEDFEHLMALRKGFPWPFINRAFVIGETEGVEAGVKEFKLIAEKFPTNPRIFDSLGVLAYQSGDLKGALEYFNLAAANSDIAKYAFPHTFLNRSLLRKEMGDTAGAVLDEKKYIELLNRRNR